jgi:hypothetical protein
MKNIDLDRIKLTSQMAMDNNYNEQNLKIIFKDNPQYLANSHKEALDIRMALDSVDASFNTPSSGVPAFMTTIYANQIIKQITQKVAFREIAEDYQQGDLSSTAFSFPTIAFSGSVSDYDDREEPARSDANLNYENRGVYLYSTGIDWGEREMAMMSAAKIDIVSQKREGAATKMVLVQNDIFFNGFARGNDIRGLLNDSDLNPAIPSPASAKKPSSAKWKYKTYEEITADIRTMYASLVSKLANNVSLNNNVPMILCMSSEDQATLTTPNALGQTVLVWLKENFPSIKIVTAVQYKLSEADSGNLAQLILEQVNTERGIQRTIANGFTFQAMYSNTVVGMSVIKQKVSSGVAGAVIKLPAAIVTMTGI